MSTRSIGWGGACGWRRVVDQPVRIFVSHSHQDNDWCRAFVRALRTHGADVWYDEQNLGFGRLSEAITREMLARPVFIPVFSPTAVVSKWVQREMEAAIYLQDKDSERIVLPVVAARCDVPPLWVSFRRISGPGDAPRTPEGAADEVAQAVLLAPVASSPGALAALPPQPPAPEPPPASFRLFAHAITDLYEEDQRRSLVQYPRWLVVSLLLAGALAVLLDGLGNAPMGQPQAGMVPAVGTALIGPWLLFAWLTALGITIEVSILRHPSLRHYQRLLLGVSLGCVLLVGMAFYDAALAQPVLDVLATRLLLRPESLVVALANFGILALYGALSVRRWARVAQGRSVNPRIELGLGIVQELDGRPRTLGEVIAGDLFVGTALAFLLALLVRADVLSVL